MTDQEVDLQRQIDDIVARMTVNRSDIDGLRLRADAAERRADAADQRADAAEHRADQAELRADDLEQRTSLDRELIAELQADGVLHAANVAELESALVSSRTIGAAIGLLMASRNINQDDALVVLKEASQRSNTKLRVLADRLVADANATR